MSTFLAGKHDIETLRALMQAQHGFGWIEPATDEAKRAGFRLSEPLDLSGYDAALAEQMAERRQAAFARAMEYGNTITAKIVGTYSDVEARTWPLQRTQADTVLGGGELPPDALLTKLAERRKMKVEAFALLVQAKAQAFEGIADVGQALRMAAEGLLDPALDTPEKLGAAVEALRKQTLKAAADANITA